MKLRYKVAVQPLAASLAVLLLAVAGCGGDDPAEEAEQVVRDFATAITEKDEKRFCEELVSQDFLERTTLAKGDAAKEQCEREIGNLQGTDIKVVEIKKTVVKGDKATVTAKIESQGTASQRKFELVREDGKFRLSAGL